MLLAIALFCLPWEIGGALAFGTSGHDWIAAGLASAAIVTLMEIANGDSRAKAQNPKR
jgi:hypothetical protein